MKPFRYLAIASVLAALAPAAAQLANAQTPARVDQTCLVGGQRGAQEERRQLGSRGVDPDRRGGVLIFSNRHQVVPEPRSRNGHRHDEGESDERDGGPVEVAVHVAGKPCWASRRVAGRMDV